MSGKLRKSQKNSRNCICPRKFLCAAGTAVLAGSAAACLVRRFPKTKIQPDKTEDCCDDIFQAVTQDLKTPLVDIMGNSLLFLENYDDLSEKERIRLVHQIHEGSNWLINMAENLSAITHIKGEGAALSIRDEIVEEVLGEALQKIEKRHPDRLVRVKIPEDFIMLSMDAVLIEQVIINLLENAILHSDSTKPIDIIVEDESDKVSFTIRDYGDGIPKDMQEHLFDSALCTFHTACSQKGTNIGLILCKTILSAHQGSIAGRNHDHGAEFVFVLPKRIGAAL